MAYDQTVADSRLLNGYYHYGITTKTASARIRIMPNSVDRKQLGTIPLPLTITPRPVFNDHRYLSLDQFRRQMQLDGFSNFHDLARQVEQEFGKRELQRR